MLNKAFEMLIKFMLMELSQNPGMKVKTIDHRFL